MTPQERTVSIRGGAERFRVLTAGRGPDLVWFHSFHDRSAWPPVLETLARRFTVHAPFHPGVQGSEGVEVVDDVVDLALAYDELLGTLGYAGVFKCAEELDEVFRRSEPPTHDDWIADELPRPDATFVRGALSRTRDAAGQFAGLTSPGTEGESSHVALGELSELLGGLLGGAQGPGARVRDRQAAAPPQPGRPRPSPWADGPVLTVRGELRPARTPLGAVLRMPFTIDGDGDLCEVSASARVLTLDGGQVEKTPPAGSRVPSVLRWVGPDATTLHGERVAIPAIGGAWWWVELELVSDAMVRLDLKLIESR